MKDDCKRKFPRVNYPCSITVWREDGSSEVVMANTANISGGGVCVFFNESLALETRLEIKIDNFFEGNPFKCRGKVVRCKADDTSANTRQTFFEIGIEFFDMDDAQRQYLLGFVDRLLELEAKRRS
jgi:c-di-GMP-binding flagellar brake protein YcgR